MHGARHVQPSAELLRALYYHLLFPALNRSGLGASVHVEMRRRLLLKKKKKHLMEVEEKKHLNKTNENKNTKMVYTECQ